MLFDLDGTLVTGELDFAAIRREIGGVCGPILEHIAAASAAERERATTILTRHEEAAAQRCQLQPGARELLDFCRERGLRVGLLTRNSRATVATVCQRLDLRFDVVIAREDAPPKPSPECVLTACRRLGVAPERCLVVGDYRFDIEAGHAAGAWTALLCDRTRTLPDVQADFEVANLAQVREVVTLLLAAGGGEESEGRTDTCARCAH